MRGNSGSFQKKLLRSVNRTFWSKKERRVLQVDTCTGQKQLKSSVILVLAVCITGALVWSSIVNVMQRTPRVVLPLAFTSIYTQIRQNTYIRKRVHSHRIFNHPPTPPSSAVSAVSASIRVTGACWGFFSGVHRVKWRFFFLNPMGFRITKLVTHFGVSVRKLPDS